MYTIDFICKDNSCNHIIYAQVYSSCAACPQEIPCPKCGNHMIKTWTEAPAMAIGENNDPESCKPSGYWRNAEKVKQESLAKKKAEEREKIHYKDKKTIQKLENRRRNING